MKRKQTLSSLALTALFSATLGIGAEKIGGGSGTEGGGRTVNLADHPALRDLNDKTNCTYISVTDFVRDPAEFGGTGEYVEVLKTIGGIHWYLRHSIESEMKKLTICQTNAPLIRIPAEDEDAVAIATANDMENGDQVGIRLDDKIFLDMTVFKQESALDQAYTLLHEIMHSFIAMKTERRNNKLRSFIASVRKHQVSAKSFEWFALQMRMNSLSVVGDNPLVTDAARKAQYTTAFLDKNASATARYLAAGKLQAIASYLTETDKRALEKLLDKGYGALKSAVRDNDLSLTEQLLEAGYKPQAKLYAAEELFRSDDPGYSRADARIPYRGSQWHGFFGSHRHGFSTPSDAVLPIEAPYIKRTNAKGQEMYLLIPQASWDIDGEPEYGIYQLILHPVFYGRTKMVRLLIKYAGGGAKAWLERVVQYRMRAIDPNRREASFQTALGLTSIAKFFGNTEISSLLADAGLDQITSNVEF